MCLPPSRCRPDYSAVYISRWTGITDCQLDVQIAFQIVYEPGSRVNSRSPGAHFAALRARVVCASRAGHIPHSQAQNIVFLTSSLLCPRAAQVWTSSSFLSALDSAWRSAAAAGCALPFTRDPFSRQDLRACRPARWRPPVSAAPGSGMRWQGSKSARLHRHAPYSGFHLRDGPSCACICIAPAGTGRRGCCHAAALQPSSACSLRMRFCAPLRRLGNACRYCRPRSARRTSSRRTTP